MFQVPALLLSTSLFGGASCSGLFWTSLSGLFSSASVASLHQRPGLALLMGPALPWVFLVAQETKQVKMFQYWAQFGFGNPWEKDHKCTCLQAPYLLALCSQS